MMRLDKEVKPAKENAFLRFRMAVNMRIVDKKESFPSRQGIAAARFADWLDARGEACGRVFAYWAARRSYLLADGTLLQLLKLRKGVDPWLMAVAEIAGETEAAWRSRGGGYADKVTSAGWSGWATHAANAKVALDRAREIHPDLPEPAFLCARVFFPTSGDAECDELFRWASSNFLDDPDFLDKYMFYKCYPRWCGSPERMKSFADACAATCRDDTLLPFFGVKSMLNVAKEGGPSLDATFSDDARYARSIAVLETVLTNGIFRLGRSYWQALHILPAVHYFKGKYERAEKAGAWYMFDDYSALFMTITGLVGPNSAKMAALHRMYNSHDYLGFLSAAEKVKKEGGLSNKEQVFLERQSANATALGGDPSRWVKASFANWKADVINYGRTWQYKNHAWHIGRNSSMSKVLQWTVQFPQDAEFEIVVRSWDAARPSMASFGFRVGVGDTRSLPLVHVARDDTRLGVASGPSHESPRSDSLQERFRWTEVRGAETKVRIECKGGCVRAWINDGAEPAVVSETHGLDNERPEDGGLRLRIMGDNVEVVSLRGHAAAK